LDDGGRGCDREFIIHNPVMQEMQEAEILSYMFAFPTNGGVSW